MCHLVRSERDGWLIVGEETKDGAIAVLLFPAGYTDTLSGGDGRVAANRGRTGRADFVFPQVTFSGRSGVRPPVRTFRPPSMIRLRLRCDVD
jgi:hypothetical protein